jgi:hypothetical protein
MNESSAAFTIAPAERMNRSAAFTIAQTNWIELQHVAGMNAFIAHFLHTTAGSEGEEKLARGGGIAYRS